MSKPDGVWFSLAGPAPWRHSLNIFLAAGALALTAYTLVLDQAIDRPARRA